MNQDENCQQSTVEKYEFHFTGMLRTVVRNSQLGK